MSRAATMTTATTARAARAGSNAARPSPLKRAVSAASSPTRRANALGESSQVKRPTKLSDAQKEMRKAQAKANRDKYEKPFLIQIRALNLPEPQREFRFGVFALDGDSPRKDLRRRLKAANLGEWRFDFAWPEQRIAFEIDGYGRHITKRGFRDDIEKLNAASLLGWTVYRATGDHVRNSYAIETLIYAFRQHGITPQS